MTTSKGKILFFLPLILNLFGTLGTLAQETADHLVISQVYLDSSQPLKSWIEVYNPTDKSLVLERVRLSHIKTINIFSKAIQDQGGIQVGVGEYVVLCADESSFKSSYGDKIQIIGVSALSRLASGGFVSIATKGRGESKGAVVRYGETDKSSNISKLAGDQVVSFSKDGKSFTRKVTRTQSSMSLSDFVEAPASPGKPNN